MEGAGFSFSSSSSPRRKFGLLVNGNPEYQIHPETLLTLVSTLSKLERNNFTRHVVLYLPLPSLFYASENINLIPSFPVQTCIIGGLSTTSCLQNIVTFKVETSQYPVNTRLVCRGFLEELFFFRQIPND